MGKGPVVDVAPFREKNQQVREATPLIASMLRRCLGGANDLSPLSCRTVLSLTNLDHETGGDHDLGTREG